MRRSRNDSNSRPGPQSTPREVNVLLHTLRGEHFRHSQNLRQLKVHRKAIPLRTYNSPSLPVSDIYKFAHAPSEDELREEDRLPPPLPVIQDGQLQYGYPRGPVPGPPIPKSWSGLFRHDRVQDRNTVEFRSEALSLIFSHTPWSCGSSDVPLLKTGHPEASGLECGRDTSNSAVQPLTQICLRAVLSEFDDAVEFGEILVPILPPRFRWDILRYTAVHDPLPNAKLFALCHPEGHTDGELIVVGPQASVQRNLLWSAPSGTASYREGEEDDLGEGSSSQSQMDGTWTPPQDMGKDEAVESWDAESVSEDMPIPLHTLIILNATVSVSALFAFPLTITRLALLALPAPTQVHRLPRICPLLEVLDLSYNPWLNEPPSGKGSADPETLLDRLEWEKWTRLKVLGLRECKARGSIIARVNKGRLLEDVTVIGVEEWMSDGTLGGVEGMMNSLSLSD